MYNTQYYINLLNNTFIYETDIPNEMLDMPEIIEIIINKNWFVFFNKLMKNFSMID